MDKKRTPGDQQISPHYAAQVGGCSLTADFVYDLVVDANQRDFRENHHRRDQSCCSIARLVCQGEKVIAQFDGGLLLSSDGWRCWFCGVEQRLRVAERMAALASLMSACAGADHAHARRHR